MAVCPVLMLTRGEMMAYKTYHDVFVEQLIRRERPGGEFLFKCGAIILGLILIAASIVFLRPVFPFFFALVVILEFFAFVYTVKEYEYSFMNGDVDVDMIQGKRHRRSVMSFNCREVTVMAPLEGHSQQTEGEFARKVDAAVTAKGGERWFLIAEREDGTRELLILSPNERLLAAFKGALGRRMEYQLPSSGSVLTDSAEG